MQRRHRIAISTLGVWALVAAAAAAPQDRQRDPERLFRALKQRSDENLDGKISAAEFPRSGRAFRRLDRNGDGFLTLEDFQARGGDLGETERETAPMTGVAANREMTPEEVDFFETRVRPVLANECYSCHAADARRLRGGLRVDGRAELLAGGATGPAVVPGDADGSALIEAIRYADPIFAMPPSGKLSDDAIRDLERWVNMGAPWPQGPMMGEEQAIVARDSAGGESLDREIDIEAGRGFWSFQPVARPQPPAAQDDDWSWSVIDRFLRAAMDETGVQPVGDADDRTWLRRVTFDLTGLPPTRLEIAAFEEDRSGDRHGKVVDRLLASDAYGERFGRHWLDVARYGESSGKETNVVYPHAWRYRDWVIDSFNDDMPYDEFLTKQLAGDLLPADSEDERAWNQIATGYLALGPKSHNTRDARQFALDVADEQIDAVSQGMLGLTLSCARCHDHKFDPIPIEDYYSLAGIFMSSETLFGTQRAAGNNRAADLVELPDGAGVPNGPRMDETVRRFLTRSLERTQRQMDSAERAMDGPTMGAADPDEVARRLRVQAAQSSMVAELLARFDERGRALPSNRLAMGMAEAKPREIAVLERGELDRPRDVAPRGMPQVLRAPDMEPIGDGSGRRELAEWIGSPDNPLTARVWVNRVWQHLFGEGLVGTPDNFGAGGQAPAHPELLDWLAAELVENGWSTKRLLREIALTHAYRLASQHDGRNARKDPDVVTLWRMPERRLEAEAIRDAMLSVSGTLDAERPVGSPTGAFEGVLRREEFASFLTQEQPIRSVYLPALRGHVVDALDAFDAPDASLVAGEREVTTVATQALFLMNDAEVLRLADAFADRLLALEGSDLERIRAAFELAFGRRPTTIERKAVTDFLRGYEAEFEASVDAATTPATGRAARRARARQERQREARARARARDGRPGTSAPEPLSDPRRAAWSAFAQSLFQSAEFRALG